MPQEGLKSVSKYCFIIPNYNHHQHIEHVIEQLSEFNLPVLLIDDGSAEETQHVLQAVAASHQHVTLLRHEHNQGKGGAVQTGLLAAFKQGFDYAIQVDADGQHCISDISAMLAISQQHPQAVVSGKPLFDDSIPKHRFISRYITHFWVCIETLSTSLADTMCGFRVYPLKACIQLMDKTSLGKRMDFDIEILVRLYWQGERVIFHPTKVIYPEDGASHFKLVKDNVLISWMHTRLFFGMLPRIPKLLARKWTRHE